MINISTVKYITCENTITLPQYILFIRKVENSTE